MIDVKPEHYRYLNKLADEGLHRFSGDDVGEPLARATKIMLRKLAALTDLETRLRAQGHTTMAEALRVILKEPVPAQGLRAEQAVSQSA